MPTAPDTDPIEPSDSAAPKSSAGSVTPESVVSPPDQSPAQAVERPGPQANPTTVDDFGRIANPSLLCTVCAASLLGLEAQGVCATCRTPVGRSIDGDRLKYAEASWLNQIVHGTTMMAGAVFAGLALMCLSVGLTTGAMVSGNVMTTPPGWLAILQLSVAAVFAVGIWQATAPEPKRPHVTDPTSRSIAHYTAPISFALLGLQTIGLQAGIEALGALAPIRMLLVTTILLAALRYARRIAERIPDLKRARFASRLWWCTAIGFALLVIGTMAIVIAMLVSGIPLVPDPDGQWPMLEEDPPLALVGATMIYGCSLMLLGPIWFVAAMTLLLTIRARVIEASERARSYAELPRNTPRSL